MKKTTWLLLFTLLLIADLVAIQWDDPSMQTVCKPLIIPFLTGYFASQTIGSTGYLKKWIFTALFFSWVGDILLLFQEQSSSFFLLGLISFLFAHLSYIWFFSRIIKNENIKSRLLVLITGILYGAGMILFLSPYLTEMRGPVYLYAVVIIIMFSMAMHMLFIKNKSAGQNMLTGAILFVISDSVLAINKFYHAFEIAGFLIMLTYGIAQLFIAQGAARYIRSVNSR